MKKVLILAYDFPPYVSVGGLRPYAWYNYLKEFGIEPIVVTRQWGNTNGNRLDYISAGSSKQSIVEVSEHGTIIRSPYKPNFANRLLLKHGDHRYRFLRKSISAYYEFAQFLLPIGPKIELYKAAKHFLKNNQVDAIIATGDPFVLFRYASKLSKAFNIPWIADYRDPWSHNEEAQKKMVQKKWNWFLPVMLISVFYEVNFLQKNYFLILLMPVLIYSLFLRRWTHVAAFSLLVVVS